MLFTIASAPPLEPMLPGAQADTRLLFVLHYFSIRIGCLILEKVLSRLEF